jgi:hypothetical protein
MDKKYIKYGLLVMQIYLIASLPLHISELIEILEEKSIVPLLLTCSKIYMNVQILSKILNKFQIVIKILQYMLTILALIGIIYGYNERFAEILSNGTFYKLTLIAILTLYKYLDHSMIIKETQILMNLKNN